MNEKTRRTEPSHAPGTEAVATPEPVVPVVAPVAPPVAPTAPVYTPRPKTIERQGQRSEPYTRRYPQVRGGTCEYCGVLDNKLPSEFQYKLCPHFRDIGELRCSYCDESVDPTHVINTRILNIAEHPDDSNKLVVWCNSYECSRKHEARFKRNK